ncbi:hypothetical protein DD556_12410 [Phaeobacter sp. JL2872]|uniref:hypothetical protein n=1 Tax=Phaeobacter TaxID=302485 RepID=UPI000A62965D|nr:MULTISPECIES: hypothetical protein [Phaeobacter]PVZ46388.1 hypothetical protein DD556_12410 [Phaeobacter sp. JL2872]
MERERLLSPKQLSEIVGLSPAQIRALMNDGRLEFVEISSKTKMLTMSGWERFQRNATRVKRPDSDQPRLPLGEPQHHSL